ncbi:hypothetical protein FDZ84_23685 [Saccharopolyspora sp. ASAGF58]|nr:hypothetical protein FDZ84_23685 [Saccharopolyspora sp. ASAGF58]
MPVPEEMTCDELLELVGEQGARITALGEQIAVRDRQITVMATQMAGLAEVNETLGERLAKLEHVLSRNSKNSSSAPSKD